MGTVAKERPKTLREAMRIICSQQREIDRLLPFEEEHRKNQKMIRQLSFQQRILKRRHRELQHESERDDLTQLYNRHPFLAQVEQRLNRVIHHMQGGFTYVACDINDFKQLNDDLGHDAGDRHLIKLADALNRYIVLSGGSSKRKSVWRPAAGRFGGDEFALIDPVNYDIKGHEFSRVVENQIQQLLKEEGINCSIGKVCFSLDAGHKRPLNTTEEEYRYLSEEWAPSDPKIDPKLTLRILCEYNAGTRKGHRAGNARGIIEVIKALADRRLYDSKATYHNRSR